MEHEIKKLDSASFSEAEQSNYDLHRESIANATHQKDSLDRDKKLITQLSQSSLVKESIFFELAPLSAETKNSVIQLSNNIKLEIDKLWGQGLQQIIATAEIYQEHANRLISHSQNDPDYLKVLTAYQNSQQLNELQDRIKHEKEKLYSLEMN